MTYEKPTVPQNTGCLILFTGIIVHILLLLAVSEINFQSSLESELIAVEPPTDEPPAKRLVLFLTNGLRYDDLFDSKSKYFLSRMKASWGIAHATFPTLERSGNLAIFTGTYEDPIIATAKSLTSRPIYVDSLIQRSEIAWLYGEKEFLYQMNPEMTSHVRVIPHAHYGSSPYTNRGLYDLKQFMDKNKYRISQQGSIFDKNGTLFVIHLPLFMHGVKSVQDFDKHVEIMTDFFDTSFTDGLTTFAVASAYGLTKWNSHGGDTDFETNTPFIAWGAGVRKNTQKIDIRQIDITPLLACYMGVSIPVHSQGVVPLEYLDLPINHYISEQATNALQLSKIYEEKRRTIRKDTVLFFNYKNLTTDNIMDTFSYLKFLRVKEEYKKFSDECRRLVEDLLEGINFYDTYYNTYLKSCITVGYFLWILFIACYAFGLQKTCVPFLNPLVFLMIIPLYFSYLNVWPLTYYAYSTFPFVMLLFTFRFIKITFIRFYQLLKQTKEFFVYAFLIQVTFLSIIFSRLVLSVLMIISGLKIIISGSPEMSWLTNQSKALWFFLCVLLAVFSAFPRVEFSLEWASVLFNIIAVWTTVFPNWLKIFKDEVGLDDKRIVNPTIFVLQTGCCIFTAAYCVLANLKHFRNQILPWVFSLVPLLLIPFTANAILTRIIATFLATLPFYSITSVSDEQYFLIVYFLTLLCWLNIEKKNHELKELTDFGTTCSFDSPRVSKGETPMFERVFMFVLLSLVGFHGSGNIFSINSYNTTWIEAFVISPISGALLIIAKVTMPIFHCVLVFHAWNLEKTSGALSKFCSLLVPFYVMVFQMLLLLFFYSGDWVQVSFAQFMMLNIFVVTIFVFFHLSDFILTCSHVPYIKMQDFFNKLIF